MANAADTASNIWKQISDGAKAHSDARMPMVLEGEQGTKGVKFSFGRGASRWIEIMLMPDNTYTVCAKRMARNFDILDVGELYVDVVGARLLSELVIALSDAK